MAEPTPEPPVETLKRPWWSRALLAAGMLAVVGVAGLHMFFTGLFSTPDSTLRDRFAVSMDKWIYPWFEQNWRLFAPNPMSQNLTIETRVADDCGTHVTPWYNLSAMDDAAVLHNPFPGHTEQNELRRAYIDGYESSHDMTPGHDHAPTSTRADMMAQYVVNIALQHIRPLTARDGVPADKIVSIEFRVTTTDIGGPGRADTTEQPDIIAWRQVSPDVVSYGCVSGSKLP